MFHSSLILPLLAFFMFYSSAYSTPVATVEKNIIPLCEPKTCPPLDCEVQVQDGCCPVCLAPDILPSPNSCTHNGEVFEDGETFYPSLVESGQNIPNITAKTACNSCTCSGGVISCEDLSKSCPPLQCEESEAVALKDTCCPVCPGLPTENPAPEKRSCTLFNGTTLPHGATYNPVIPPYGLVPCLNCTCNDSRELCVKLPCPPGPLPVCSPDDPIDNFTLCCPKCKPDIDECATGSHNCSSNAECTNTPGSFFCTCNPGYTGNGVTCTEIVDECATGADNCDSNAECTDTPGRFTCTCNPGYTGDGVTCANSSCVNSKTVTIWRHNTKDAVTGVTFTGGYTTYSWSSVDGEYVREKKVLGSNDFPTKDFHFVGYAPLRRLLRLETKQRFLQCDSKCAKLTVKLLRTKEEC